MSMPTTTSTPSTTGECPWSWPAAGLLPKAGSTRRALGERCRRSSHQGRKSLSHQKRQALTLDVAHDNDWSSSAWSRGGSVGEVKTAAYVWGGTLPPGWDGVRRVRVRQPAGFGSVVCRVSGGLAAGVGGRAGAVVESEHRKAWARGVG